MQIRGRDAGDTRAGAGGGLVGEEATSGVAEGVPSPVQEASVIARISPKKRANDRFIYSFFITV